MGASSSESGGIACQQPAAPAASGTPSQETPKTPQASMQQPLGTAAAPDMTPGGAPASRPAGAAMAAGKQKRAHVLAVRIGLLVGAGIAVGTVAGLSLGSPNRSH